MTNSELTDNQLQSLSRLLSRVLRHEPELVGIRLDAQGWVLVDELTHGIQRAARAPNAEKRLRTAPQATPDALQAVVATNSKQRFELSADRKKIRAVQGHSVEVDLGYAPVEPPRVLFHGTAFSSWSSIAVQGLQRRERHAVHLSLDVTTAQVVGSRHGRPTVLEVAAAQMHDDGFEFTRAPNETWLVDCVPPKYLRRLR